jgi:hypothetical protein
MSPEYSTQNPADCKAALPAGSTEVEPFQGRQASLVRASDFVPVTSPQPRIATPLYTGCTVIVGRGSKTSALNRDLGLSHPKNYSPP